MIPIALFRKFKSFLSRIQFPVTLSMVINEKCLIIEMLRECDDNVREMFYIKFIDVQSPTTFLLSLTDFLYVI